LVHRELVPFEGGAHGTNITILASVVPERPGIAWVTVHLDDVLMTKFPLIVEHKVDPEMERPINLSVLGGQ
jgi:hypothetical protein